jgi:hypothetical protein
MERLGMFVERCPMGEGLGRTAYVTDPSRLPQPSIGFEWRADLNFRPDDALRAEPGLKTIFEAALQTGCEIVWPLT